MDAKSFTKTVYDFYTKAGRHDLPWRKTHDPYAILVSEIMLQQTQALRVIPKYEAWMDAFPTLHDLAAAPLPDVLILWQGLGYNRRALHLKRTAEAVVREYGGTLPREKAHLRSLPGIGPYTAGAVQAFAWNIPVVLIETNIRTVFIHHFFQDAEDVHDRDILLKIQETLDRDNPRAWYSALMDYGAHLKALHPNPSRRSTQYKKQSRFEGSRRQLRAKVLRTVLEGSTNTRRLHKRFPDTLHSLDAIIDELIKEGFIAKKGLLLVPRQ